jgi:hypothetical protein
MLVTNRQLAKLPEPGIDSFHNLSAFVAAELAAIFIAPQFVVLSAWRNQFDSSFPEPLAQRAVVVAAAGYNALRLLQQPAVRPEKADFGDCGLRKLNFTRECTFQPNSHRKTVTVGQYPPRCHLATPGFADPDRRLAAGLQGAVEAKEEVAAKPQGRILGSITIQDLIAIYP